MRSKDLILRTHGGLGNQLFQVAYGRLYSKKFNLNLKEIHDSNYKHKFGRIKELGKYLRDGLKELKNVEIVSSHNEGLCAGLTTYKVEGMTGPELQKILWDKERLQPRSVGKELMRHSVHIYNKKTEIDRTFNVIKSL